MLLSDCCCSLATPLLPSRTGLGRLRVEVSGDAIGRQRCSARAGSATSGEATIMRLPRACSRWVSAKAGAGERCGDEMPSMPVRRVAVVVGRRVKASRGAGWRSSGAAGLRTRGGVSHSHRARHCLARSGGYRAGDGRRAVSVGKTLETNNPMSGGGMKQGHQSQREANPCGV